MKKIISSLIAFSLFITIFPVTIYAEEVEQYYTVEQIESIVNKYNNNEDMFKALFCEDSAVGYWRLINDINQNGALSWMIDTSSKLIGEYPEKQNYAEILGNLIIMQSGGLAEQIENQSRFDDMKDIADYVLDIIGIASSFIGASGVFEKISPLISAGTDGISDVIIKNNEQAKYYEATLQDYSQAYIFLSAISKYAECKELRNVATALLEANDTLLVKRLQYLTDASENIIQYEAKFFVNNMSLELLKETDLYATDETIKWFVDEGIKLKNNVLSTIDAATFAFKMTMLAGDIGFGTSDVYNRYQEMKVIADIANALVKGNESVAISNKDKQTQVENIREKCNYYKALLVTHARGEYLIYQLLMNNSGVLSDIRWIVEYFKNPKDTTDTWYESQLEILIKYYDILDEIFLIEDTTYSWEIEPQIEADEIYYAADCDFEASINEMYKQFESPYAIIRRGDALGLVDMDGNVLDGLDYQKILSCCGHYALEKITPQDETKQGFDKNWVSYILLDNEIIPEYELGDASVKAFYFYEGLNSHWAESEAPEFPIPVKQATGIVGVCDDIWSWWDQSEGLYAVYSNGDLVTDFIYDECGSYSGGFLAVCKNGKWGYINENGTTVIPIEYDASWKQFSVYPVIAFTGSLRAREYCYGFSDGYIPLRKGKEWELRDMLGESVIPPGIFEEILPVQDGKCWVKKDGKWGVIRLKEIIHAED